MPKFEVCWLRTSVRIATALRCSNSDTCCNLSQFGTAVNTLPNHDVVEEALMVRITCVSKPSGYNSNPHEAIATLGWLDEATSKTGRCSRIEMYDYLKGGGKAFVRDARGDVAYLYPRENQYGTKYVQTYADGIWKDNLLAQPQCA